MTREGSNLDHIRASIISKMLEFTREALEILSEEGGLTFRSAQSICEMLLPGINGVAVAITDTTTILGYAGVSEEQRGSYLREYTALQEYIKQAYRSARS